MGLFDWFARKISNSLADRLLDSMGQPVVTARAYRLGDHPEQLKTYPGQFNDNVALNLVGLIANRIVSQTIGDGVEFDFEGESETEQEKWITECLSANHEEILFHRCILAATEAGTGYLYIMPGGVFGEDEKEYPRLVLVDPAFVSMDTSPEDFELVLRYTIQYKYKDANGKEVGRKRVIEQDDAGAWHTLDYRSDGSTFGRWELMQDVIFPFEFPPMIHWQNSPSVDSVYGVPDITDSLLLLQNKVNFNASNLNKIIRFYAHPQRFAKMLGQMQKVEVGPDEMPNFQSADGGIFQLEQMGDLVGSLSYLKLLRQTAFDTARVVDIDSMQDKLGALTNFGLRVLYQDNVSMINTKRELFGDMLEELVRRLQIMGGMEAIHAEVLWEEFIPKNETEEVQAYTFDLTNELASKQTISGLRGYDWEQEQKRIDEERQAAYTAIPGDWYANTDNQAAETEEAVGETDQSDPGSARSGSADQRQ